MGGAPEARVKRGCSSMKAGFQTKAKARVAAGRAAKNGKVTLAVYRCPDCRRWHMTHKLGGGTALIAGGRAFYGRRA